MHRNQYLIDICIMEGCTVLDDSCIECGTPEDWESAMANQLWTDERIERDVGRDSYGGTSASGKYDATVVDDDDVKDLLREMRDDYEQHIAALKAENERLRALLPNDEVLAAIETAAHNDAIFGERGHEVRKWLIRFDSNELPRRPD